jgi:hypothetical protein
LDRASARLGLFLPAERITRLQAPIVESPLDGRLHSDQSSVVGGGATPSNVNVTTNSMIVTVRLRI